MNTQEIKIDIYKNVFCPKVIQSITLKEWFEQIKQSKYSQKITAARRGELDYNRTKKALPCCTFNFNFEKEKLNSNIKNTTGVLYIDVDNKQFDINILDKNKVLAYYHSFGGKGYTILVKVTGLNLNNFKITYLNICTELGIIKFIDLNAIKATQFNVISFDKSIYINYSSTTFFAITNEKNKSNKKRDTTTIIRKEEEKRISGSVPFLKLKFKLELNDYKGKDCIYIKEGACFYECYIPFDGDGKTRVLRAGERHTVITMYFNNLLCLNPTMSYQQACVTLKSVISSTCEGEGGIPEKDIEEIIKYKYKQLEGGNLKPVGVRVKKWWVNPNCDNKLDAYLNARKEPTTIKMEEFFGDELCNIKNKVTYKYIANWCGLSEKTIKRRITDEQKQIIKEHNKQL